MIKVGDRYPTLSYGIVTVVGYQNCHNITVEFEDKTRVVAESANIRSGEVKNRNKPSVYGVGFLGYGNFKAYTDNKPSREYSAWFAMLQRCYDPLQHERNPAYAGCTVAPEWHNFQNFAKWYTSHPNYGKGFEIDKDLTLVGNREYSPSACSLVPREVNLLLQDSGKKIRSITGLPAGVSRAESGNFTVQQGTGLDGSKKWKGTYEKLEDAVSAYCRAKEDRIRFVADKYKDELSSEVYNNLVNYPVSGN